MLSLKIFLLSSCIFFLLFYFFTISYYFSKKLAKWLKNVQRIDNRRSLEKSMTSGEKLQEIVRITREISRIYKIKMPEVGIYPSNEVNAFATGPAHDTLIAFSSNLVNIMSIEEIRGVVGHELSHLIHYDLGRILLVQGTFDFFYWLFIIFLSWIIFQPKHKEEREEEWGGEVISRFFKIIFFHIIAGILRLIGIMFVFWYIRKRELEADLRGAKIVGIDNMLSTLRKLLALENKKWVVDGIDLTEDENISQGEPNSISLLKFNPEKKKKTLLDLFRTHPTLEERIERLEILKRKTLVNKRII